MKDLRLELLIYIELEAESLKAFKQTSTPVPKQLLESESEVKSKMTLLSVQLMEAKFANDPHQHSNCKGRILCCINIG